MATVSIIFGDIGSGKTMYAVRLMAQGMRRGRRQYSSFPCAYAAPLLSIAHSWCEPFAGSDMTWDEAASDFNARDFKELDRLAWGALSHSRHQDVRIRLIAQHPATLDTNLRRLATRFVHVHRVGPSGEAARPIHLGDSPLSLPWWRRPWWFKIRVFGRKAFGREFELMPSARPLLTMRVPFNSVIAASYSSWADNVPPSLQADVDSLRAGAAACASLPRYQFLNGRPLRSKVPPLEVWWPVQAKREAVYQRLDEGRASVVRRRMLEQLGVFLDDPAPEDAVPPVPDLGLPARRYQLDARILAVGPVRDEPGVLGLRVLTKGGDVRDVAVPVALASEDDLVGKRIRCSIDVYAAGGAVVEVLHQPHPVQIWDDR